MTNPVNGWSQTAYLPAGDKVHIPIPTSGEIPSGVPHNVGYHITSTAPIALYSSNYKDCSWDFALILPTYVLSDRYIVQNYQNHPNRSERPANIAIVATEDGTELSMVLPCVVTNLSLPVGSPFTITLNEGESLLLRADQGDDFSGMEIHSEGKPFALFQGCESGQVGDNSASAGSEHLYEQALPLTLWGTEFVVDATLGRTEGDRVLVSAGEDDCTVYVGGNNVATLMRGETFEYILASDATAHITTTQPAYACLYLMSYHNGGSPGDPGAATLPPVNRWVCHSDFVLQQCNNNPQSDWFIPSPCINIITENATVGTLALDGVPIPASQFSPISGTAYSHTRMHIGYGAHTLDAGGSGFFEARAYGLGRWCGYAYNIDIMVDTSENPSQTMRRDTVFHQATICPKQEYSGYGFSVDALQTGTPGTIILLDSTVAGDTLTHYIMLTLTIIPTSYSEDSISLDIGDTILYLDSTITTAGDYTFNLTDSYGCDSIVTLHVRFNNVELASSVTGGCPGDEVTLSASGIHAPRWSSTPYDPALDSLQGCNPITVHPMAVTTYHILDTSGNIVNSITVNIEAPAVPCIEANRDFIDFDDPSILLQKCSTDHTTITWIFSDGYTHTGNYAQHIFKNPLPDTVYVTVHSCNQYNCCTDTTIKIPTEIRTIWFPNIILPSEPQNDRFGPHTSCQVAEFEIHLFNRRGLLVWHSTDINETWDGTHHGTPVPQSTYVYHYSMKDIHGKKWEGVGMVMLIR